MQNTSRVNSTGMDSDKDRHAPLTEVFNVGMGRLGTSGDVVYRHGLERETDPRTFCHFHCYFCYLDAEKTITANPEAGVIMNLQIDTDRHSFEVEPTGLKNAHGITTSSELDSRLESDGCLQQVYEVSTADIERILEARKKDYGVRGYVWEDQETMDWDENVIEVKTRFQSFEEKERLWDIFVDILETTQKYLAQVYHREIPEDRRLFVLHLSGMG